MADMCSDILNSTNAKCLYLAAVLVLVLLIFMQVRQMGYYRTNENFSDWQAGLVENEESCVGVGYPLSPLPYSAGGRVRTCGQGLTSTNQIPYSTGYNFRV